MNEPIYFDSDDGKRIDRTVKHFEDQIEGAGLLRTPRRQFFDVTPVRLFLVKESAGPPEALNNPVSVKAQPFEGESIPQLAYEDSLDEEGHPVPKLETIYHTLPGMRLCPETLAWCVYAYSGWYIMHAEQWPVSVQQIDADGFPDGSVNCTLIITDTSHEFSISTHATAEQLLEEIRKHPLILDPLQVKAIGGPLTFCAINLMFGPSLTGKSIKPLQISNLGLPPGQGLRVRLLSPTWSD